MDNSLTSLGIVISKADIKKFAKEQLGLTGKLSQQQRAMITLRLVEERTGNGR